MKKTASETIKFQRIQENIEKVYNETQKKGVFSGFHSA